MFYDNFIQLCASVGKSPSAVVLEIGLKRPAVTHWKNGRSNPTDITLQKIANYFGVTVEELLADAPEQKEKPAAQGSEPRDPLIAELVSYAEGADEDGVRMLIEMAKRLRDSRRD